MRVLGGGAGRSLAHRGGTAARVDRPRLSPTRRFFVDSAHTTTLLTIAFAAWGVAIAISLLPLWEGPAPAGQLPGLATKENFDARAPMRFVLGLMVLPIALPLLLQPLVRRVRQPAPVIAAVAMSLWYVAIAREPLWVIVPPLIAIAMSLLDIDLRWTRLDWILIPATGATVMALIDVTELAMHQVVVAALLLVLALRVAVACIRSPLEPALAFLVTPLALALQTSFFARDQRYFGWHVLAIVVVTPFLVRLFLRNRRRALAWLAFAIYPIAVYSYMNATSLQTAEGKPRTNFFEDSHSLMPASEYLRGERPYRDVLPVHGLLEDGGFDTLGALTRGATLGGVLSFRTNVGMLNAVAVYALGFALTGVAEGGVVAWFLWLLTASTTTFRVLPALFTLAAIVFAVRHRRPRWLIAAGVGCVVCGLTSLDYALFTTLILLFAAFRMRAMLFAAIGLTAGAIPLLLGLALFGILGDFVRATFVEVVSLGPVYVLPPFTAPASMAAAPHFPEVLAAVLRPDAFPYIAWLVVVIAAGVALTRPRRRRDEPLLVIALWIVLAGISYGERHHIYFKFVLPALAIAVTWTLWRRRHALAWVMIAILVIAAIPTTHVAVVGWMRGSRGPIEAGWTEVAEIPRARGAFLSAREAEELRAAKQYVDVALNPNETFFDFTNRGIFYFLLDRDCPIRQVEVAYYESETRQREVIEVLRTHPHIRAALVPEPGGSPVDGVPNRERAPLVWQYLEENFTPDFARGDVVFWRRK